MCYRAGLLCRGTWTGPPRSELEHRVYKGRWGKLGWFCHRKRRRRGDLCCLQLPGGRQQRRRSQTLLMVNSNRMRCNEHDLEHGKSPLDTRKNCESCEALEQGPERMWNLCPWRNLTWQISDQSDLTGPASRSELDYFQRPLPTWIILWFHENNLEIKIVAF